MALLTKKNEHTNIPSDAVELTRNQAINYQASMIKNWPNLSETFALRTGSGVLVGVAAISAFFINKHFRYKLKVGHYGRGSSYLAVIGTPAIISGLFHYTWVQPKILLSEYDCPVCLETRAGLIQGATATLWPFVLGPLTSFMLATRYFTFRLPSLTEKPKEILSLYLKFTKSGKNLGLSLFAINMLAAMFITSMEISEYMVIMKTMLEHDRKIDDGTIPLDVDVVDNRVQKLGL